MKPEYSSMSATSDHVGPVSQGILHRLDCLVRQMLRSWHDPKPAQRAVDPVPDQTSLLSRFDFSSALVAIFATNGPESQRMKSDIEAAGGAAMIIPQRDVPEVWLRTYAPRLTCCVVAHDHTDTDAAIDFCLRLRFIAPELVIALTLTGVRLNDFSNAMMPICDVTLRRPVSRSALFLGMQAACDNRAGVCGRRDPDAAPGDPGWQCARNPISMGNEGAVHPA